MPPGSSRNFFMVQLCGAKMPIIVHLFAVPMLPFDDQLFYKLAAWLRTILQRISSHQSASTKKDFSHYIFLKYWQPDSHLKMSYHTINSNIAGHEDHSRCFSDKIHFSRKV